MLAAMLVTLFPQVGANAASTPATPVRTGATVLPAVHVDVSKPLREIVKNRHDQRGQHEAYLAKPFRKLGSGTSAVSGTPSSSTSMAMPATVLNFDGVGNGFIGPHGTFTVNSTPPDTNLAVGPNHAVEIVNTDFAIFNKSGTPIFGPVPINTLWSGFGGSCETDNDGDPIAKYDRIADRWVLSQFAVTAPNPDYLQCVAVSQTSDPTGAYNRYSFSYGSQFPDYPKMSVWPDAYYVTFNMFNAAGTAFLGGEACAYDRAKMLTGAAATQQCFNVGTNFGGLLPSDLDGSRQPAASSPSYLVADGASANQLAYWQFHTDWTAPANTTLAGPTTLATAAFTLPCNNTGGICVPQAATTQQLDTLGDRLMYRLAYRNFGDHEALVVNRSVTAGTSTGIRWYELRTGASNSLNIFQQGTYAPDSNHRWMGSIAQDQAGNMGLGFSVSGSSLHPEISYTGRLVGDPAGTMTKGEGTIIVGAGSQTANINRWGDYSTLAVDPSDDCTFWYANEYIPANGTFNWKTRIATFKFPSCGTTLADFAIWASPRSQTLTHGDSRGYEVSVAAQNGFRGTVNLSASGFGAGASGMFNPTSVNGGGISILTVATTGGAATGSFPFSINGSSGSLSHNTSAMLVINAASPPDFTISASPTGQTVTQGSSTSYTLSVTAQNGFTGAVNLSASGFGAGTSGSFTPITLNGGGGISTLNVTSASNAATGTFPLTINGISGSLSHNASELTKLIVQAPTAAPNASALLPSATPVVNHRATVFVAGAVETGDSTRWTSGTTSISTTWERRSDAVEVGGSSPLNGDSKISEMVSAPSGTGDALGSGYRVVSFWYQISCAGSDIDESTTTFWCSRCMRGVKSE